MPLPRISHLRRPNHPHLPHLVNAHNSLIFDNVLNDLIDPIIECDEKWGSWSRSISYKPTATQIFTKVLISTKTSYGTTHTCSSTCGKVCYADVKTLNSSIWSSTSTEFDTYVSYVTYKGTTPGCSIPPASCTSMLDDFDRSTYAYNQWELGPRTDPEPPWPRTPACQQCRRSSCIIEADGNVELIYWPVATNQSRDMCTDFPTEKLTDPFQPVTRTCNLNVISQLKDQN